MTRDVVNSVLLAALFLAVTACGARAGLGSADPAEEHGGRRAALANLRVQNQTAGPLVIGYRAAVPPGPEIVVGAVPPDSTTETAPIPAGEPIILVASREDGAALELPPRSFPLNGEWIWVIPGDARFVRPGPTGS